MDNATQLSLHQDIHAIPHKPSHKNNGNSTNVNDKDIATIAIRTGTSNDARAEPGTPNHWEPAPNEYLDWSYVEIQY